MTVAEIIALVKDAIEDESFDDDKILGYVNKGVGRVAAALPLPLLTYESVVTCKANTRHVALPGCFFVPVKSLVIIACHADAVIIGIG